MRAGKLIRTPALLVAAVALMAMASAAQAQTKPPCDITGPEASCGPVELCGPEGNFEYYWAPPNGGVQFTRCITATVSGEYVLWTTDLETKVQSEPCFHKLDIGGDVKCEIFGPDDFCKGSKVELCGPEGEYTYAWTGPGDFTADTRCITVDVAGEYSLTVTTLDGKCSSTCKHELSEKGDCFINCPRTIGYWGAQCAQRDNGSTKFTVSEVTQIASCIDGKVGIFNWGDDFAGFCAAINPATTNQRTQAKRQFAGLLANVCTGELGLIASNGDEIQLSLDTPYTCNGVTRTIGELIAYFDERLQYLEGQNLSLGWVKSAYGQITTCADNINNGEGIGTVCEELEDKDVTGSLSGSVDGASLDAMRGTLELGTVRAFPNPFKSIVSLAYAVAPQGEQVSLGVYDISGRLVKRLYNGFQSGGVHQSTWNATDGAGARVRTGMYFIRGTVGERNVASRVMLVE